MTASEPTILPSNGGNRALIVVDLLEDFFDAGLFPSSALPARRDQLITETNRIASHFREAGSLVIWVRQEFLPELGDAFPHMRKKNLRYTIAGTPGCEFLTGLDVAPTDPVITKKRFSAFFGTELDAVLRKRGIETVALAGITTAWCIRATATDAYQLGYTVLLAEDCLAAFTDEAHREALTAMNGYITSTLRAEDVSMEAAVEHICAVPDNRKARAVTDCLTGEVAPNHPSSILQEHPAPFCFIDEGSASRLRKS